MSKSSKPVRQDYIAKVRYINNLPPPPVNPKFLKYNVTDSITPKEENEYLLSSLFRKENFNQYIAQVDEEYGMNLNPLQIRGFFESSGEQAISAKTSVPLHPKDRVLLRDAGIGKINTSEPGVSFLRRTEYIADRQSSGKGEDKVQAPNKNENITLADPESQLRAVEQSFEDAQRTLLHFTEFRHPRKKNLRAVDTFPILPDTAMMDTKFLSVKFSGSASINRELQVLKDQEKDKYDESFQKASLSCAIYRPITSEDGEWMSFYQNRNKMAVEELKKKLDSTEKEQPVNLLDEQEDDSQSFSFRHWKNYDMQYHRFNKPYEELALKFAIDPANPKKRRAAYYSPLSGRVELKKHRAATNAEINRFLEESTVDVINFKLREPNTNEIRIMDNVRSEYDPMEYEAEDEEEEEEEEDDKEEKQEEKDEDKVLKDEGNDVNGKVTDERAPNVKNEYDEEE